MKRYIAMMITIALVTGMGRGESQGGVIADARGDYVLGTTDGDSGIVPATGTGEWRYLRSDTVNPTLDPDGLDLLLWANGPPPRYVLATAGGSQNQVGVFGSPGLAADEIQVQVSFISRPPPYTLLRWIAGAGEVGTVDVAGTIRHLPVAGTGDGSTLDIFADGVLLFSQFIAPNDSVGFAFNETPTVGVGSTVDFVFGPNFSDLWDLPTLKATISLIPEPSAFTLALLGLLAPGYRSRAKNGDRLNTPGETAYP